VVADREPGLSAADHDGVHSLDREFAHVIVSSSSARPVSAAPSTVRIVGGENFGEITHS
jgi:hypothetical protein